MTDRPRIRFDRNEFAGSFGDLGTDLPLLILVIFGCGLDARNVLVLFGVCQIFSALAYRLPLPVQPLKAMAAIAIAEAQAGRPIPGSTLAAGGLIVGAVMLALSLSGGLKFIGRIVPKTVVRGIQVGLGIKLAMIAMERLVRVNTVEAYVLAAAGFVVVILLRENRRLPAALVVVAAGLVYSLVIRGAWRSVHPALDLRPPELVIPAPMEFWTAFLVLAVAQLPLSLGNAILATKQTVRDLFPGRSVTLRKLALTYSACNLVVPLLGGMPVCQGSGGVAGHHTFGARTGGSTFISGVFFLLFGLLLGAGFSELVHEDTAWGLKIFPMALLCVLLFFEAITIIGLSRDMMGNSREFFVVLVVGLMAAGLPRYGFAAGLVGGVLLHLWLHRPGQGATSEPQPGMKEDDHA